MRIRTHPGDAPIRIDFNEVGIMRVVVRVSEEREVSVLGFVEGQHATEIEIHERVAVKDEKLLIEVRQGIDQGAGGSTRRCFLDTTDTNSESLAITEVLAHHIRTMMHE